MRKHMIPHVLLGSALVVGLSACNIVYKLPTRQGNVLEQSKLEQIEVGMTRDQVRFLLGTPLAASPFTDERWDYLGFYRSPRGQTAQRVVSLYFDGNSLVRAEGIEPEDKEAVKATEPEAVREDLEALGESPGRDRGEEAPDDVVNPLPRGPSDV